MTVTINKDLIVKAQGGDAFAFEALVNHYYETMFKFAFKFSGNKTHAEDITQDACIRLAKGLHSFKHDSAFTSWLYTLVINTGKDYFRRNRRYNPADDEVLEMQESKAAGADETLYAKQVIELVQKLPEGERDAVILVLSEGLSHKEAGDILGCKESTVSWRIHEARKKLADLLSKEQKYG
jgi:RNA polymerase sigma-70 factor (ECF subfamily)